MLTVQCKWCNKPFQLRHGNQIHCSSECREAFKRSHENWKTYKERKGVEYFREKGRQGHLLRREERIQQLGGKCECCGESDSRFLAFDHKDGGGTQRRKDLGTWSAYKELFAEPGKVRLLCHNCNYATSRYGVCPHKENDNGR